MKEKISDKFYHIENDQQKFIGSKGFSFMALSSTKNVFHCTNEKCEQNLKCTALICINAPKVETIKNTISICLDLICLWDHEFKINKVNYEPECHANVQ